MWKISALFVVLVLKYPLFPVFQHFSDSRLLSQSTVFFFLFSKIPLEFVSSEKQ